MCDDNRIIVRSDKFEQDSLRVVQCLNLWILRNKIWKLTFKTTPILLFYVLDTVVNVYKLLAVIRLLALLNSRHRLRLSYSVLPCPESL